jgi:hypothetical protein
MLAAVGTVVFEVVAVLALGLLLAVLLTVRSLGRRIIAVEDAVLELRAETVGGVELVQEGVARANAQVDRLADAAGLPEIDERPRPITRVPKMLRSRSVVKAMALGTGTAHAARRLRHGSTNGTGR